MSRPCTRSSRAGSAMRRSTGCTRQAPPSSSSDWLRMRGKPSKMTPLGAGLCTEEGGQQAVSTGESGFFGCLPSSPCSVSFSCEGCLSHTQTCAHTHSQRCPLSSLPSVIYLSLLHTHADTHTHMCLHSFLPYCQSPSPPSPPLPPPSSCHLSREVLHLPVHNVGHDVRRQPPLRLARCGRVGAAAADAVVRGQAGGNGSVAAHVVANGLTKVEQFVSECLHARARAPSEDTRAFMTARQHGICNGHKCHSHSRTACHQFTQTQQALQKGETEREKRASVHTAIGARKRG